MDLSKHYEICSPGVIAEDFDGDIVILNLEDGRYFSLQGAGPNIWAALIAGATPQSILDSAERDRPAAVESTREFVSRLFVMQLIRAIPDAAAVTVASSVDWKSASSDQPGIEVFEDLAELILADPVHDVDAEAGWPMRKAA